MTARFAAVVAIAASMVALACGVTKPAPTGEERGRCRTNGTCNAGLVCEAEVCVRRAPSGAAGTTGAAGATGVAGTTGSAGADGGAGGGGAGTTGAAGTGAAAGGNGDAGPDTKGDAGPDANIDASPDVHGDASDAGPASGDAGDAAVPSQSCVGQPQCYLPQELVPAPAACSEIHLALDGERLWWTDKAGQTVNRVPTVGGPRATFITFTSSPNDPTYVAADDGFVYWVLNGGTIYTTGLANQYSNVVMNAGPVGGMVRNPGGPLYYSGGKYVRRDSGGFAVAMEETGMPRAVAVDQSFAAFVTDEGNVDVTPLQSGGALVLCATDDASGTSRNCVRVAKAQSKLLLADVYLLAGQVYWANGPSVYRSASNAPSGTLAPLATTAHGGDVTSFFVRGDAIFLAEDGYVELARIGGAALARPIAAGQSRPTSVRADAERVYWTRADCAIESLRHE